jgi:putative copper export protein
MLRGFSSVAMISVGVIAVTGVGTCLYYFNSWSAVYGTAYDAPHSTMNCVFC